MALAAAARRNLASRSLSILLERRLCPSLPQLLPSNSTGDPRKPSPLPLQPAARSVHFALAPCGTSQTLNFIPFGLHLLPGPPRRSFSSSSREIDFTDVLTDAAIVAAPAASFPGEVAWAAEESSMAVAAVQNLIDAVHSFTGLNWWISIALSTALLRSVSFTLWMIARKQLHEMRQEVQQTSKLVNNAKKDDTLREEAERAVLSSFKKLGLAVYLPLTVTPYTLITLHIAISNMVENVPSLKGGGAFWFTDLTTPDALCIFPMITSLFIVLTSELKYIASRKCEGCSHPLDKVKKALRVISVLSMLYTATLPQAISCVFVTWSSIGLAERIALDQPGVQKVLFGAPLSRLRRCNCCDGQKGPTAEEAPSPAKDEEEPVSPETKKSSDASVHRDDSDTKGS